MKHHQKTAKQSDKQDSTQTNDHDPSDFELQILGVLWQKKKCTAREVLENLTDGKQRAYTSVLSVMQVMHRKGLIEQTGEKKKLAHVYRATVSRGSVMRPMLRGLVQKVFGGSGAEAAMHLIKESKLSNDELDDLETWVQQERQKKDQVN